MYTISQFAKLCNTSTKTIRFYDNKGILPADYVSEENGYRFYEKDTVEIFRQISKLKEAGFTLAEIDQHLKAQDGISTEKFIDKKIEELKSQIAHCYKLKEQDNMREINIAFQKLEAERTTTEQAAIINLWYGNQKTLLPVATEIIDECEKLIQRIATTGICAINCEEDEFIRFVQGRKQQIIETNVLIERKTNERRSKNGELMSATSLFNKKVEKYLKKMELNDDSDRIIKYAHMADTILEEYKIRLQKNKISVVALTMTECYKKLANKKTLINRISMDPITLDLYYEDYNGIEINKASLSAGEKQLMVISLLWALALCSKKKLPVIIDTPLSRLDSAHREALITTYFPQASEQTIILSTDSEIDRNYHDMMKNNIGDEFTLIYDDDSKSTTIQRGYFGEGDA